MKNILSRIFLSKLKILLIFLLSFIFQTFLNSNENLIVTLTSWKGRINLISKNLERLLNNTIKPKKLILNLAKEEFPRQNLELPQEILKLLKNYKNFEIFWVEKNNNVFKKLIPTLNRFQNDLIITVDDDILYPYNSIENMLKCYKKYGGNIPVSFGPKSTDWNIKGKYIHSHYGAGSIVKYKYYNNKIDELYKNTAEDRINKGIKTQDDLLYTYAALLNGYMYKRCNNYFIKTNLNIPPHFSENNNKNYIKQFKQYHHIIRDYIKNKYYTTIKDVIKKIENSKLNSNLKIKRND